MYLASCLSPCRCYKKAVLRPAFTCLSALLFKLSIPLLEKKKKIFIYFSTFILYLVSIFHSQILLFLIRSMEELTTALRFLNILNIMSDKTFIHKDSINDILYVLNCSDMYHIFNINLLLFLVENIQNFPLIFTRYHRYLVF